MGNQAPPEACQGIWEMRDGRPRMLNAFELVCRELAKDDEDASKRRIQEALSDPTFLRWAVDRFEDLEQTSVDDLDRLSLLPSLAHFLQRLFEIDDLDLLHLDKAQEYLLQAIDLATRTNVEVSFILISLAYNYVLRSSFTLEIEDANTALEYGQQAVEAADKETNCERQADKHSNNKKLAVEVANEALDHGQRAIRAATKLHYIGLLESILRHRCLRTNQLVDLQHGIRCLQKALEELPQEKRDVRAGLLNNLSNMYGKLFLRKRSRSYIDLAIAYGKQALNILEDDGLSAPLQRSALCITLRTSNHHRTRRSPERLSATHPQDCVVVLHNLAHSYELRSSVSHEAADEDEAIRWQQQAITITSPEDPQRFLYLANLASVLRTRFRRTGHLEDIDEAICRLDEAVNCQPEDHDNKAFLHFRRGALYEDRAAVSGEAIDLKYALLAFLDGFGSTGTPSGRLGCAYRALMICEAHDRFFKGYLRCSLWPLLVEDIVKPVLKLFPADFYRASSRDDRQNILRNIHGWPSSVASLILTVNEQPVRVIEALEVCRGIVASSRFDAKFNVAGLEMWRHQSITVSHAVRTWALNHPGLWSRYANCHDSPRAMDMTSLATGSSMSYAAKVKTCRTLESTLTGIGEDTRSVTGYERFLLPPTANEMMEMAREGAIVTFIVTPLNSAALLVTPWNIQALALHDLRYANVRRWAQIHQSSSNPSRRNAELCEDDDAEEQEEQGSHGLATETSLEDMFRTLWDVAVKPVLQQLQGQGDRSGKLPRIWWIGGGLMGSLPLHAAGYHNVGSTENTLSHVVSSYALTLKSLQLIRAQPPISPSEVNGALVLVSMPTTPGGYEPLNVAEEVQAIKDSMSPFWPSITTLERPNKGDVLTALRTCSVAHFACHGAADRVEPVRSSLLIGRDNVQRLTVEELQGIVLEHPRVVYLSACSTAETGGLFYNRSRDASIHLASVFQSAGFPHAIGTLWGADDHAAAEVAKNFYRGFLDHTEDGHIAVARALHNAVLSFRNQGQNRKDLSKWAPFVYFGC